MRRIWEHCAKMQQGFSQSELQGSTHVRNLKASRFRQPVNHGIQFEIIWEIVGLLVSAFIGRIRSILRECDAREVPLKALISSGRRGSGGGIKSFGILRD
jgi:hypothetical protein